MATPSAPTTERTATADSPTLLARVLTFVRPMGTPLGSVLFAFVIGAIVVAATRGNALLAYESLACGGFGVFCQNGENSALQLSNTLVFTTPLILTGLAVAVAFRAGLFNIGAEGQLVIGAIAATVVGIKLGTWPAVILLPAVLVAGTLAGAAYGGVAGVLKAVTGAHEVVTTIMLNYVALWLSRYLIIGGPLQAPGAFNASPPIAAGAQLPRLVPLNNNLLFGLPQSVFTAYTGIFVSLLGAVVYFFIMRRTALGYEITAVGQSQRAARYAGISVRRTIIVTMLISGAFAGLAGAVVLSGLSHGLVDTYFQDTTGFDAIAVSLLGQNTAIGVTLAALLFGALHAGGQVMEADASISHNLVFVLEALVLFSLAANFLRTFKFRLPAFGRTPTQPAELEAQDATVVGADESG